MRQGSMMKRMKILVCILFLSFNSICFAEEMKVFTVSEPPTNFVNNEGQLTGITVEFFRAMQKQVGNDDYITYSVPFKRVYKMFMEKPNIILFTLGRNKIRENKLHWIAHITRRGYALYAKKESEIVIKNLEEAKKFKAILSVRGAIRESILKAKGFKNVSGTNSHEQSLKMLNKGRAPLMASSSLEMASLCHKMNINCNQFEQVIVFFEADSYIGMSKSTPIEIVNKWKEAAKKVKKSGEFKKIAEKWVKYIDNEYGVKSQFKNDIFYFWKD